MVTDPVSDLIIRLKNAALVKAVAVEAPYSLVKEAIAEQLLKAGYLSKVVVKGKKEIKVLDLSLAYDGREARLHDVKRLSKPSRRVYYGADDIRPVRQGRGRLLLSTSRGIMSGEEARQARLGGEALFLIW